MRDARLIDGRPNTDGMYYMSGNGWEGFKEIAGDPCAAVDLSGSFFGKLKHAAASPFHAAANIVDTAISTPLNMATRIAATPFVLANRAVNAITPSSPGGGSPGAPSASPSPMDAPSPDGQGDPNMSDASGSFWGGMHPRHHHHRHAMSGFGLPSFLKKLNPFDHPAGKLLVSATPGGVTALEAHSIATKALKNGDLDPKHLKAAGALTKAARSGHKKSIAKIAKVKQLAGRGDPHAEVALDRLKLADSIQRGHTSHRTTSSLKNLRNLGLATLRT